MELNHVRQFRHERLRAKLHHAIRPGVNTGRAGYRVAGEHVGALSDEAGPTGAASPLPHAGGAGRGSAASGDDALSRGEGPTPNPSRMREGLHASSIKHNAWTPARKAAFLHHLAEKGNVRSAAARVGLSHQSADVAGRRRSWEREGDGPRIMFLLRSKIVFLHVARVI